MVWVSPGCPTLSHPEALVSRIFDNCENFGIKHNSRIIPNTTIVHEVKNKYTACVPVAWVLHAITTSVYGVVQSCSLPSRHLRCTDACTTTSRTTLSQQSRLVGGVNTPAFMLTHLIGCLSLCAIGFVCYDDACHLRRFTRNSVRSDVTE